MKRMIDTASDARSVVPHPFRTGMKARDFITQVVQRLCNAMVIDPTILKWASPVVPVSKKDGSVSTCIDKRKLNAVTVRDTYLHPRMDECIEKLGHAAVFYMIEASRGY